MLLIICLCGDINREWRFSIHPAKATENIHQGLPDVSASAFSCLTFHIHDNAIYIGADNTSSNATADNDGSVTDYETAYIDKTTKTFNKLTITTDKAGSAISIKDKAGNTRKVTDKPGLFNLMATEYIYNNDDKSRATIIRSTSSAVIHLIDGPLMTEK